MSYKKLLPIDAWLGSWARYETQLGSYGSTPMPKGHLLLIIANDIDDSSTFTMGPG